MDQIGAPITGPGGNILPMSAAIRSGDFVFLAGQLALRDGKVAGDDITEQTQVAIDNIEAVLKQAGLTLANVVRANVWLVDAADFGAFNQVYQSRFQAPYPARSTVVSALVLPGARVEIEVMAEAPRA